MDFVFLVLFHAAVTTQILDMYEEAKKWQIEDVHGSVDNKRKLEVTQEERGVKLKTEH
jgi:hypothetical protein